MADHHKYRPLVRYLTTLPPDQEQVILSFTALAELVGPLPRAAQQPGFWQDVTARRNWQRYGFHARLTPDRDAVHFTRVRTVLPEACTLCARPAVGRYAVQLYRHGTRAPADEAAVWRLCREHLGVLRRAGAAGSTVRAGGGRWRATLLDTEPVPE